MIDERMMGLIFDETILFEVELFAYRRRQKLWKINREGRRSVYENEKEEKREQWPMKLDLNIKKCSLTRAKVKDDDDD